MYNMSEKFGMIALYSVIIRLDRIIQSTGNSSPSYMLINKQSHRANRFLDSPIRSGNDMVCHWNYPFNYTKTYNAEVRS